MNVAKIESTFTPSTSSHHRKTESTRARAVMGMCFHYPSSVLHALRAPGAVVASSRRSRKKLARMRDIPLNDAPGKLPIFTMLNYGDTRTGKTEFGATWPRPMILADVAERGYTTIKTMDREKWFEPNVEPMIKGIENMNDLANILPIIQALIASGRIMTVVFDAFTFYTDFFLNGIIATQSKPDNRAAYGTLGLHLRKVRTDLHSLKTNVVWNCLARHPDTDNLKGGPMIPGQQADKFAAGVDFLVHSRIEQIKDGGKIVGEEFQLRTRQYNSYICGNRLGTDAQYLPDPFIGTYSDLMVQLGYDVEALRKSLPSPKMPTIAAPVVVKPPVNNSAPKVAVVPPKVGNNPVAHKATNNVKD